MKTMIRVKPSHIYIVDDDQSFGRSLKRLLEVNGRTANYFSSAQEFLDLVPPETEHGIAIIDIYMPECGGFELMEKMRDAGYRMPVILITGHNLHETERVMIQHGAVGLLRKPFSEQALLELIDSQPSGNDS